MARVLLIEDNAGDVEIVRRRLLAAPGRPFELTSVDNLGDGIAAHAAERIDVVLLDLNLPDSGGLATIDAFRAAVPDTAIVVLTGTSDLETAIEALRRGADDYLSKPDVSTDLLTRTIRYAVERRRMMASLDAERRTVALLQAAGAELASHLQRDELVQKITDVATRLVGAAYGAFFHEASGAEGGALELYALSGAPAAAFASLGNPRGTPMLAATFHGGTPVRADDVRLDPRYGRSAPYHGMPPGHPSVASYLAVPVALRDGRRVGSLLFGHPERGRFTAEHERLALGVAGWAALAMDNARLYDEAVRTSQARENLLQVVSHDLRNHMNTMLLGLGVVRPTVGADGLRAFDAAERAAKNMLRLLEDLVDVAAIEKGVLSVDPSLVDVHALMDEARALFGTTIESKGLTLDWPPAPRGVEVWADRERIIQVIGNLVGNAVKFTPRGGLIRVTTSIAGDGEVVISVADSGAGIPAADHSRLFDRFFRGSRPKGHGAGLGLSIAHALVTAHRGRLWVESELGHGATFSFALRRAPPAASTGPLPVDG